MATVHYTETDQRWMREDLRNMAGGRCRRLDRFLVPGTRV